MMHPVPPARYQKSAKASQSGGYGLVEIWHDTSLAREVVIKWTAPENAKQLIGEVRALSRQLSAHIVEIYDVVLTPDGQLRGIIMEYLTGVGFEVVDLTDPANRSRALALLYQMAQGLADLHAAGLVHRDVKPANAVCTADGRLKLVDFGLSTPGVGAVTVEAKGTLAYAAPEMFGKPPISVTAALDAYSFGMVCWKKLVGMWPDVGPMMVPDSVWYPLPSIATKIDLPPRLAMKIDACLEFEGSKRPHMQEVADALMAELVFGKHTACVMRAGKPPDAVNTDITKASSLSTPYGTIDIGYDGYQFTIKKISGEVFVNNSPAQVGQPLYEGCLLTFGGRQLKGDRIFVPFRQSSPEIVF
ncbi:serine/threonine-protein kinase [Variovorax sp. NFACC27]|uniref:serine/threonine-protein kinase n=1 Tax=unclassified Variovorax TaxID=663243 RepID=UPI000896F986|nr:serine/threonine protein kinase [Variovorax sp. NFACC28]SEG99162.1 serine/threonine protein kinase [Variovorax sp. NFACC29]SFE17834.1 serine/threonine protein kinase [Variovorax sp. NFACC26]SFH23583.1 serine/threonine protein kinase [Variovorax sp. NFACC27]